MNPLSPPPPRTADRSEYPEPGPREERIDSLVAIANSISHFLNGVRYDSERMMGENGRILAIGSTNLDQYRRPLKMRYNYNYLLML